MDATLNYKSVGHHLARSPDKQKGVWRYSFPVNLTQEASATVCWPLLGHIRPACLQVDSGLQAMVILSEAGNVPHPGIVKDLDLEPNEIQQLMKNKTTWCKFVSAASTIPSKDDI